MERYKENIESRKDQNLMSFVLMVCFLMVMFSFVGALSVDTKTAETALSSDKVAVSQNK